MWIISTRNSGLWRLAVSNLHKISPCGSCHETSISKLDGNKSSPPVNTPQTPLLPQPFLGLGKTFIEINSDILFDRPNTAALLFFFLLSCRCCSFSTHCRRKGASCGTIMLICRHEELGLTWVWQKPVWSRVCHASRSGKMWISGQWNRLEISCSCFSSIGGPVLDCSVLDFDHF